MEPTTYTDQSLRDLLRRIARRRRLLLVVGSTVFLVVAAWTFLATPRFESRAVQHSAAVRALLGMLGG